MNAGVESISVAEYIPTHQLNLPTGEPTVSKSQTLPANQAKQASTTRSTPSKTLIETHRCQFFAAGRHSSRSAPMGDNSQALCMRLMHSKLIYWGFASQTTFPATTSNNNHYQHEQTRIANSPPPITLILCVQHRAEAVVLCTILYSVGWKPYPVEFG